MGLHRELFEYYNAGGLETSEELELAILLRDQEALNSQLGDLVSPFESLRELKVSCVCSQSTLIFLLVHCPSLTSLAITSNPDICNETIAKMVSVNSLKLLECLEISEGELDRKIKGIQYWKGISQAERETLKKFIQVSN